MRARKPSAKLPAKRLIVPLVLLLVLNLAVRTQLAEAALAEQSGSETGALTMHFHMYSKVYSNAVSIFIYNGADTNPPTYATPLRTPVSCSSSALEFQQLLPPSVLSLFASTNVWFGGVSWITQPLTEDKTVQGNVNMTVWMSATDPATAVLGYTFGMVEIEGMTTVVGEPMYGYYVNGSAIASSPRPFQVTFNVDRTFAKGHLIAYFVGLASASKGWVFEVYFDSPTMDSFAALPVNITSVPEFSQLGTVSCMILVLLCFGIIYRRKPQARST